MGIHSEVDISTQMTVEEVFDLLAQKLNRLENDFDSKELRIKIRLCVANY